MDIWQDYVKHVIDKNPEYWTRYANYTSNYYIYRKVGNRVEEVMNYKRYRKIIATYITRAKKAIIQGEALNITNRVGKICARRVERDFRKKGKPIDWGKTNVHGFTIDDTGKKKYNKVVYFTDDDWCRIGWHKTLSIANESVYEFKPAGAMFGNTGFKTEFIQALKADDLLRYQYLFFTIRQERQIIAT